MPDDRMHRANSFDREEALGLDVQIEQARRADSPRYQRAHRTTNTILGLLRYFLPLGDDVCRRRVQETVFRATFASNAEIICVPPECDEFDRLALERRRLEQSIQPIQHIITKDPI